MEVAVGKAEQRVPVPEVHCCVRQEPLKLAWQVCTSGEGSGSRGGSGCATDQRHRHIRQTRE